jgi:transposase
VLFAIEREINGLAPQTRLAVRQERSRPLVTDLEAWLRTERAKLSSKNPVAKAIQYSLKRWAAMIRFLDDGRVCLSNNAADRALRGIAVVRHNWTFAGSERGGERAAAIYTLIETCKLNDVDPAPGSPMSWHACPIIPRPALPSSCPGTGNPRTKLPSQPNLQR